MSRVWVSQPQISVPIDWSNPITKGLIYASNGNGYVWSNVSGGMSYASGAGGPKDRAGKYGVSKGFNTLGTGSTDRIDTAKVRFASTGYFTYLAFINPASTGGGGFGRVTNPLGSSGVDDQCWAAAYASTSPAGSVVINYPTNGTDFSAGVAGSFTLNTWQSHASVINLDSIGTLPSMYKDGVLLGGVGWNTAGAATGAVLSGEVAMSLGNRSTTGDRGFDGLIGPVLMWQRGLSAAEIKSLSDNPWQIFAPLPSRIFVGPAAAVTNPSGDLAATEGSTDTSAFTGIVLVQGTAAATDSGSDTFAATGGALTATGTLAATETGDDTAAATGTVLVKGALAATDTGDDTFAATGGAISAIIGTMSASEFGDDTCVSSGTILVKGLLAALEDGGDTVYIDGQIYVIGACAATETGSDTFAAAPFSQTQLDYLLAYIQANMAIPSAADIATAVWAKTLP